MTDHEWVYKIPGEFTGLSLPGRDRGSELSAEDAAFVMLKIVHLMDEHAPAAEAPSGS